MKRLLILFSLFIQTLLFAQQVTINESGGWFESAYVKWSPVAGADYYNVYYSGEGVTDQKVDDQLIRNYGSFFRVDIPGLKPGQYNVKIVPVMVGQEGTSKVSGPIDVEAFDRSGFAFTSGGYPGAYNADGTAREGAVILYITENTKNTIELEVTGANSNPCVGLQAILDGFKKGKDNRPLIVRFVGQITDLSYLDKGDIVIDNKNNGSSHITLEGVGDDAVADGWGIRVKNASNIEIRNIGLMNCDSDEGDNIGLQQNNDHIWVHHCDFFYGDAGGDSDQAKGDGALDCKRSTYVTFSFNHFWDTGKSNLLGLSEGTTEGLFITYHHNWFDHSDSRHPRVRYYSAHVYNNYYDGNSKYGVGSTEGSSVFVEANYFRNCKYPMLTSMQGTDVYDESSQANDYSDAPTFSKEDGGTIKAFNNFMEGERRFVPYGGQHFPNSTVDFDAYVADTREEQINASVVSAYGNNTYNNFDVDAAIMYDYTPDSPEAAKDKVIQNAGRLNGGDFTWTFNNSGDDTSYDVIADLKAALKNYKTSLIAIQGDGESSEGGEGGGNGNGGGTENDMLHDFTASGLGSSFYNISGNLSDSKGTVIFGGLTLTQCLKIESSTVISFTTTKEADLILVFNEDFSGSIKVDEVSLNATSGILETKIDAGNHQITKADVANLYLISVEYVRDNTENSFPEVINSIADQLLQEGFNEWSIDLSSVFVDLDGDELILSAISRDEEVATVKVSGAMLTVTEKSYGNVDIVVAADDGHEGLVSEQFSIKINAAPKVLNPVLDQEFQSGFGVVFINLSNVFESVDGDNLDISARADKQGIVTLNITGNSLEAKEVGSGEAEITLTADDGFRQQVSSTFRILVREVLNLPTNNLKVYPNPTLDRVRFENREELKWSLFDPSGRLIQTGMTTEVLDMTSLRSGIYVISIGDQTVLETLRVVKQ